MNFRRNPKHGLGHLERLEHQILFELEYSGTLDELTDLEPAERAKDFDRRWRALGQLVWMDLVDRIDEIERVERIEAKLSAAAVGVL